MNRMTRIIVLNRLDQFRFEIDPAQVIDARSTEEVNGEHSVTVTTLQELEKTDRILIKDGMGYWHEYVVLGIEESHTAGGAIQHEYYCVWSLQYDLSATYINDQFGCGIVPGHASIPQPPRKALECALEGTVRWSIGTITVTTQASASFYRRSGWEGMQTVVERWGGELHATIGVSLGATVSVTRAVDLLAHEGASEARRRFDYGFDVTGIKRIVSDDIWPCRIVPLGKSMETEEGGYTRRPDISSVNSGVAWLQDDSAVPLVRIPDGSGGWEYPTAIIKNDTYEEPADLKAWALQHISDYTRPIVSYEAEVAQFAQAGLNPHGVALGDEVTVVDRTFGTRGLRITARVIRIESSLLDPADVKLTIGNAQSTLAGQLSDLAVSVAALSDETATASQWRATSDYMSALLGRINDEANATGGYTYITEGQGLRTYDVPVSDPLVGAEANSVVEVKGGTIRIANTKDAQGNWEWKSVFTSGHIAAEMITVVNLTAGYIGNTENNIYWDLDAGTFSAVTVMDVVGRLDTVEVLTTQYPQAPLRYTEIMPVSGTAGDTILILFKCAERIYSLASLLVAGKNSCYRPISYDQDYVVCNYPPRSNEAYPTIIGYDSGVYTYMAKLTLTSDVSSSQIMYNRHLHQNTALTLTDFRAYKIVDGAPGTIDFSMRADGEDAFISTHVMAGSVMVQLDDMWSELTPGTLVLSNTDYTSRIRMSPQITITHETGADTIRLEYADTSSANRAEISTNGNGTSRLPGYLSGSGCRYVSTTTIADIVTSPGSNINSLELYQWGPFMFLRGSCSISNTAAYNPTATNGVNVGMFTLKSDYRPVAVSHGSGKLTSGNVPADITAETSGGVNATLPPGTYTAAGKTIDFSIIYFKAQ